MARGCRRLSVALAVTLLLTSAAAVEPDGSGPGRRVLLDAHNAYPYNGRGQDRLDRALSTGLPIAIEQDLVWYRDPVTGAGRSLVSHGDVASGSEPTLAAHFFERIRPMIEQALSDDTRTAWPLIVLNLDLKTNEPDHHSALWDLLGRYEPWLTTAERRVDHHDVAPLDVGPVMVLTGERDEQEAAFHHRVAPGERLRLFGAVHPLAPGLPGPKTNYRRWWNNPWSVVEPGGPVEAGGWTKADDERLTVLVRRAHAAGLWIRFYTLNGHDLADETGGWSASYNFGSLQAAQQRWQAGIRAGVDFIAVDQYEAFAAFRRFIKRAHSRSRDHVE